MGVSDYDARIAGCPETSSPMNTQRSSGALSRHTTRFTLGNLVRAWIYTLVASSGLFLFLYCWFDSAVCCGPGLSVGRRPQITGYAENHTLSFLHYLGRSSIAIARMLFWVFLVGVLNAYVTLVLSFYPATRYTSERIVQWIFWQLAALASEVVAYFRIYLSYWQFA